MAGRLAGGCVAAESFPGTEAEEGARPIGEHHEAGEELEDEQSGVVSMQSQKLGRSPYTHTYGGSGSPVVIPLAPRGGTLRK